MDKLQQDKWTDILIDIDNQKETYSQDIQRRTNITFSHIVVLVQLLEKAKLISKKADGRKYQLTLTDKGQKCVKMLREISHMIK